VFLKMFFRTQEREESSPHCVVSSMNVVVCLGNAEGASNEK